MEQLGTILTSKFLQLHLVFLQALKKFGREKEKIPGSHVAYLLSVFYFQRQDQSHDKHLLICTDCFHFGKI